MPPSSTPLKNWLSWLLHPTTPGQRHDAPAPKAWVFVLCALLLAAQVVARYQGLLYPEAWLGVHVLAGWALVLGALRLAYGPGYLASWSRQTWITLGAGYLFLLLFWHLGRMDSYGRWVAPHLPSDFPLLNVMPFAYFVAGAVVFRLVLPSLLARPLLGTGVGMLGLRRPPESENRRVWPLYLVLYLVVLPSVVFASGTPAFQARYPLARALIHDGGIDVREFAVYAASYSLVFVSGEFFWRGWFAFGTERDLGPHALLFALVPYVCGHFGKPLPETLGAIAAGTVLGWLALKHRTVWLGVAVHYGVALSMDLLAITRAGLHWT